MPFTFPGDLDPPDGRGWLAGSMVARLIAHPVSCMIMTKSFSIRSATSDE
jgi:hypothetical protein